MFLNTIVETCKTSVYCFSLQSTPLTTALHVTNFVSTERENTENNLVENKGYFVLAVSR